MGGASAGVVGAGAAQSGGGVPVPRGMDPLKAARLAALQAKGNGAGKVGTWSGQGA